VARVVLEQEIGDGLPQVAEEPLGDLETVNGSARDDGEVQQRIVPA